MAIPVQKLQEAAARYRHYAKLCREFALTKAGSAVAETLLAQAKRWDRDADWVDRDCERIVSSQELLDKVQRLLEQNLSIE